MRVCGEIFAEKLMILPLDMTQVYPMFAYKVKTTCDEQMSGYLFIVN